MKPAKLAVFLFSGLLAAGASGYGIFYFAERYAALNSKLRWAKQQEKIMTSGLENLSRQRKDLESAQLDFSSRMADQEEKLKSFEEERAELLDGIRRISEKNRELTAKEEEVEAARSEAADLVRRLNLAEQKGKKLYKTYLKAKTELIAARKALKNVEEDRQKLLAQQEADLSAKYNAEIDRLRVELKALQDQAAENTVRLAREAALEKELEELRKERMEEQAAYFYNMGVLFTRFAMYRKAEQMYLKTLQVNPADAPAHHNLGILYESHLGASKEAIKHYKIYIQLTPDKEERGKVLRWIEETERNVGHSRRTYMKSGRQAFERYLLTTV